MYVTVFVFVCVNMSMWVRVCKRLYILGIVCRGFLAKSPTVATHFLPLHIPDHKPSVYCRCVPLVPCPTSHNPLPRFQGPMFAYCPPHLFYNANRPQPPLSSPFIWGQLFFIFSLSVPLLCSTYFSICILSRHYPSFTFSQFLSVFFFVNVSLLSNSSIFTLYPCRASSLMLLG